MSQPAWSLSRPRARGFLSCVPLVLWCALVLTLCARTAVRGAGPEPGQLRVRWEPSDNSAHGGFCVLDGAGLGLTSLTQLDLRPYAATTCTNKRVPITVADFSRNALSSLGRALFYQYRDIEVDFSHNLFRHDDIDGLFNPGLSNCSLCTFQMIVSVDLSYNNIGPVLPFAVTFAEYPLFLISVGVTDVPSKVLRGTLADHLDLSLNDLRNGLHPLSFAGQHARDSYLSITLNQCNLRTESLPVGVFDMVLNFQSEFALSLGNGIIPAKADSYLPRGYFNDSRLFTKDRFTPPDAAAYVHRLPTPQEYLDSWSNCFVDFPSLGALASNTSAESGEIYTQPSWTSLVIGDVLSFSGVLLDGQTIVPGFSLTVDLAPQSAAIALGFNMTANICPLQSLAHALTVPFLLTVASPIGNLVINAYDQFLPESQACAFPACAEANSCPGSILPAFAEVHIPTEPSCLLREVGTWLNAAGLRNPVAWTRPKHDIWNPALNRSDWTPVDLLCDLRVNKLVLPALPWSEDPAQASMPFGPPDSMLRCVTVVTQQLDWSAASIFPAGMLQGLPRMPILMIYLNLQLLYRGITPVPLAFFDSISYGLSYSVAVPDCATSDEYGSCKRMLSTCPVWRNGECEGCPVRFTPLSWNSYYYCGLCPAGSMCDPAISDTAIECPTGTYQPLSGSSNCNQCSVGTYNAYSGQTEPSSCLQCSPGRANPYPGGFSEDNCVMCRPGSASGVPGVGLCPKCAPGTYQTSRGENQCDLCGSNTYNPDYGSTSPDSCRKCPDATPQSAPGSGSQLQCTAERAWCPPGTYTAEGDLVPCKSNCPRGASCNDGVATPCPPGSYADQVGRSNCTDCGAGRFGSFKGSNSSTNCVECQLSSYSEEQVASVCQLCPVGTSGTILGALNISSCVLPVNECLTAVSIDSAAGTQSGDLEYCALGATVPIHLNHLLTQGVRTMREFMHAAAAAPSSSDSPTDTDVMSTWAPLKLAPSLRLAAFGADSTLEKFDATHAAFSNTSSAGVANPTQSALSDAGTYSLFAVLMGVAFLPWFAYRLVPARVAVFDQFKQSHMVAIGESIVSSPTQLGAAFTWSFVWVAILVAILLGTESNTISTTELVPPSAAEYSGTAQANWQITLRAYTGDTPAEMSKWCIGSRLLSSHGGLTGPDAQVTPRAQVAANGGQSCDITVDCLGCGMSANAFISLKLPFNAQLIEWELWVNSAQSGSWSRSYGVRAATPGDLQPAQATISFNAIESYFVDARHGATGVSLTTSSSPSSRALASRSGFEFSFVNALAGQAQSLETFNSKSQVGLAFSFTKSDIILHTQLTNKQTALQIIAVVASTVVSLFALFGLVFKLLEAHVWKRCGWSTGPIVHDESGVAQLRADLNSHKTNNLSEPFLEYDNEQDHANHQVRPLSPRHDLELSLSFSSRPGSAIVGSPVHSRQQPRPHSLASSSYAAREVRLLEGLGGEVTRETL